MLLGVYGLAPRTHEREEGQTSENAKKTQGQVGGLADEVLYGTPRKGEKMAKSKPLSKGRKAPSELDSPTAGGAAAPKRRTGQPRGRAPQKPSGALPDADAPLELWMAHAYLLDAEDVARREAWARALGQNGPDLLQSERVLAAAIYHSPLALVTSVRPLELRDKGRRRKTTKHTRTGAARQAAGNGRLLVQRALVPDEAEEVPLHEALAALRLGRGVRDASGEA